MLFSHYVHDVEFIDCVFGAQSLNRKSKISPSTKNNIEKIAGIFQEKRVFDEGYFDHQNCVVN